MISMIFMLNHLREQRLIAERDEHDPDTLDCHSLIREHFGDKLQNQNPNAWKQAHARLYEYYKNLPEKELPDTLEEMEPLFAAVMHGCLAGKHQEAMDDVYWNRIKRGNEHYSTRKMGAFGADLSCLSSFFEVPWDKPASGLSEAVKAVTLSWAGFRLRAVGRLSEAAQPMEAALEMRIKNKLWENAAMNANNLSELFLTLGNVESAQQYGAQSVTFADRSGEGFYIESFRTTHADALHQAGENSAAEKLFIEAEDKQKRRQPKVPWLYSLWGFRFSDLLLSMGKYQEALERTRITVNYEKEGWYSLLDVALDKLTIGKAHILLGEFVASEKYLNQAVDGLREAGTQYRLPWELFARATLYRHQQDFLKSWTDLDEAREIAEYGQMRLHLTDYHLEACRNISCQSIKQTADLRLSAKNYQIIEDGETLSLTQEEMQARFQQHFKQAERLIKETGYHRRDGELEELRKKIVK